MLTDNVQVQTGVHPGANHSMDALPWMNVKTLERVLNSLFGEHVTYTAHTLL